MYAPELQEDIDLWPDAFFETADAESPTGLRLSVSDNGLIQRLTPTFQPIASAVENVSGAGTNSAFFARFDAAVGELPSAEDSTTNSAYLFLDLDADPPVRVPYEASTLDEGLTVVLKPIRPLRNGGKYAVIITREALAQDGDCLSPSQTTRDVLMGASDDVPGTQQEKWDEALMASGVDLFDISVITAFTVQNDQEIYRDIAETINGESYDWMVREPCVEEEFWRRCEMIFEPLDFREGNSIETAAATGSHQVQVTAWLPLDANTPAIPIVFGHGANTERELAAEVAEFLAPEGFAIIASEALEHGDHPIQGEGGINFLRFLGVDITTFMIDGDKMRGNFNQSALEWVQLLQLVKTKADLDGDGEPEWNTDRVGYFGISMGALIGSGVNALSDDVDVAILSMGGGWLTHFLTQIEMLRDALPLLYPLAGGESEFHRLLIVAQSAIDVADPATWGRHVFENRLLDSTPPHLLFPVTVNDEIVPFTTGQALTRSLNIPQVGPVFRPIALMETQEAPANMNFEGLTAGYMQFDIVTGRNGQRFAVDHSEFPRSEEAKLQVSHYLMTWRDEGVPEIILPEVE